MGKRRRRRRRENEDVSSGTIDQLISACVRKRKSPYLMYWQSCYARQLPLDWKRELIHVQEKRRDSTSVDRSSNGRLACHNSPSHRPSVFFFFFFFFSVHSLQTRGRPPINKVCPRALQFVSERQEVCCVSPGASHLPFRHSNLLQVKNEIRKKREEEEEEGTDFFKSCSSTTSVGRDDKVARDYTQVRGLWKHLPLQHRFSPSSSSSSSSFLVFYLQMTRVSLVIRRSYFTKQGRHTE